MADNPKQRLVPPSLQSRPRHLTPVEGQGLVHLLFTSLCGFLLSLQASVNPFLGA